jgi:hypothetical protein
MDLRTPAHGAGRPRIGRRQVQPPPKFVHVRDADRARHCGTCAAELDKPVQYSGHDDGKPERHEHLARGASARAGFGLPDLGHVLYHIRLFALCPRV